MEILIKIIKEKIEKISINLENLTTQIKQSNETLSFLDACKKDPTKIEKDKYQEILINGATSEEEKTQLEQLQAFVSLGLLSEDYLNNPLYSQSASLKKTLDEIIDDRAQELKIKTDRLISEVEKFKAYQKELEEDIEKLSKYDESQFLGQDIFDIISSVIKSTDDKYSEIITDLLLKYNEYNVKAIQSQLKNIKVKTDKQIYVILNEGSTLKDLLKKIDEEYSEEDDYFINGEKASLNTILHNDDEFSVIKHEKKVEEPVSPVSIENTEVENEETKLIDGLKKDVSDILTEFNETLNKIKEYNKPIYNEYKRLISIVTNANESNNLVNKNNCDMFEIYLSEKDPFEIANNENATDEETNISYFLRCLAIHYFIDNYDNPAARNGLQNYFYSFMRADLEEEYTSTGQINEYDYLRRCGQIELAEYVKLIKQIRDEISEKRPDIDDEENEYNKSSFRVTDFYAIEDGIIVNQPNYEDSEVIADLITSHAAGYESTLEYNWISLYSLINEVLDLIYSLPICEVLLSEIEDLKLHIARCQESIQACELLGVTLSSNSKFRHEKTSEEINQSHIKNSDEIHNSLLYKGASQIENYVIFLDIKSQEKFIKQEFGDMAKKACFRQVQQNIVSLPNNELFSGQHSKSVVSAPECSIQGIEKQEQDARTYFKNLRYVKYQGKNVVLIIRMCPVNNHIKVINGLKKFYKDRGRLEGETYISNIERLLIEEAQRGESDKLERLIKESAELIDSLVDSTRKKGNEARAE